MIKCKEGKIKVNGSKAEILAELTTLINALVVDKELITKEEIEECVRLGTMEKDDLKHELVDKFFSRLYEALGGDEDGE